VCVVDIDACGDAEELNRKRKHHEISPIKWTAADADESGNTRATAYLLFY